MPSPRLRRWLITLAGLLAVYTIVGFLVVPPVAKAQAEKRLSAELGRSVRLGKIAVNPFTLSITIDDFAVLETDGATTFVGWRRVFVDFDALASLRGEWVLSEVALDGFTSRVVVNADQSLNFSDILAKHAPKPGASPAAAKAVANAEKSKPRPVRLARLAVTDARLDFSDASLPRKFATAIGPVSFTTTELRAPSAVGAPYSFEATTEAGERIAWSGTLQTEPVASIGEFAIENISIPKYAPYYAHRAQADLTEGKITARGRYEVRLNPAGTHVAKLNGASIQLRGLKVVERAAGSEAIALPAIDLTGLNADGVALTAHVAAFTVTGGQIRARREKDGSINLLAMLQPAAPAPPTRPAASPSPSAVPPSSAPKPEFTLGELAVKDLQVEFADQAAPRPVALTLTAMQLGVKNLSLAAGATMPVQVAFAVAPQGSFKLVGAVQLAPLKADLKLDLAGLEFPPFAPYVEQFANARLAQGSLTTSLAIQAELPEGAAPRATLAGDVRVEKLGVLDARSEEIAGFRALQLRGLKATSAADLAVALDAVEIDAPYARVVVNADKSLNLAGLARQPAAPAPTAAPSPAPATPAPGPKIDITRIVIRDGDFRFTDRSLEPHAGLSLRDFGGTIAGLSSSSPTKGELDLKATVDGTGPVAISGTLDPLGAVKTVDLKVDLKNVDLLPLGPYSGKFAGFELARGKLALDVKLKIDGPVIDSANVLTLRQFTFGAPVQSPDATKLPVRLGVALLKDLEGNIVIDVPVAGRTDDPSFQISRVVWRVIGNLLAKVATSPFALLGAAFGGGGDELAFQEFATGASALNASETKKLETMVTALKNRPGLSLALEGGYDTAADTHALKRVKLADTVRRAAWEKKRETTPNLPPPDQFTPTPEEAVAATKRLFDEKFPPGTPFGAPLPAAPKPVEPPPKPQGFFKRIVSTITREESRQRAEAEKANAAQNAEHARAVAAARAAGLPLEEMTGRLAEAVEVDANDLRALAQARAERVRDYFLTSGGIAAERIFLAKAAETMRPEGKGPRVFLELQ
ncbi:MAG: DUF748 domain-containing protein [Opitutaceae bacterium]|nr:DUF748 domain-containing protein [Opitutaceae bacterium]